MNYANQGLKSRQHARGLYTVKKVNPGVYSGKYVYLPIHMNYKYLNLGK